MLLGAAMGGGSAALTGGDPLKGALMGGITGGIGGGISTALGAAAAPPVVSLTEVATPAFTQIPAGQTFAQASQAAMNPVSASAPGTLGSGTYNFMPDTGISNLLTKTAAVPPVAPAPAVAAAAPVRATGGTFTEGMQRFVDSPLESIKANPITAFSSALKGASAGRKKLEEEEPYSGPLSRFKFNPNSYQPSFFAAEGGIANLAAGGYDRMVGEEPMYMSNMASGGISNLGSYSDGGRMLKGPGDGMSDSIPASISGKRPARLADGEFVVPADVVSHLGNGSTDAGAKQLYAMMNKVRQARTGRKSQGREIDPRKYTPAYA
jgi:hypothetical protein